MKICFVQPNTRYQVKKHRHALALTFPQIIANFGLSDDEYELFFDGKTTHEFEEFILENKITHVLITSITSTFPRAIYFAKIAKKMGCITALGGIFASVSYTCISENFNCFDYICIGKADKNFFNILCQGKDNYNHAPVIYKSKAIDNFDMPLGNIMINDKFKRSFKPEETVCYEITQGCPFECSFCTLRKAFGRDVQCRNTDVISQDLSHISYWKNLKLIDDDIKQSASILEKLTCKNFEQVIAETRIDNINNKFMDIATNFGISHIITGVESFNKTFLSLSNKTNNDCWRDVVESAVTVCNNYKVVLRPVVMLNYPGFTMKDANEILETVKEWTPNNNIELLLSFYTPHPGFELYNGELLTNDLSLFDHLNMVYWPESLKGESVLKLIEIYNKIVEVTSSEEYNPYIQESQLTMRYLDEYNCFFCK